MFKILSSFCLLLTFSTHACAEEKLLIGHFYEWNGRVNEIQTKSLSHLVYNHFNLSANADINMWNKDLAEPHLI